MASATLCALAGAALLLASWAINDTGTGVVGGFLSTFGALALLIAVVEVVALLVRVAKDD